MFPVFPVPVPSLFPVCSQFPANGFIVFSPETPSQVVDFS